MRRIHCFQHVPFEGLGSLAREFAGWPLTTTHWYQDDTPPAPEQFDWLVVMGGPMNINDEAGHPWLAPEKRAIRAAIDAGKTVIGICLGAQLIASVLGARVMPGAHREIGWFEVRREPDTEHSPLAGVLPEQFQAFHWHGDTFEVPEGALRLASSEACKNQIFSYGDRVIGFQCHLETTLETASALIEHCADELDGSTYVQTAEQMLAQPAKFDEINRLAKAILHHLESVEH